LLDTKAVDSLWFTAEAVFAEVAIAEVAIAEVVIVEAVFPVDSLSPTVLSLVNVGANR
jgi:hypothetical protein